MRFTKQLLAGLFVSVCMLGCDEQTPLERDARLNQKLTLREASTPLNRLLTDIEARTGVSLRVDKALAERRTVLYAPERPLREVMTHLATAFGAEWQADLSEPPAYTLKPLPLQGETRRTRLAQQRAQNLPSLLRSLPQGPGSPMRLLDRLTESEINALRAGKTLEFSSLKDARLEAAWLRLWKASLENELGYLAEALSTPKGDMELASYYGSVLGKLDKANEVRLRVAFDPATGDIECALGLFADGELVYGATHTPDEDDEAAERYTDDGGEARLPGQHPWAQPVRRGVQLSQPLESPPPPLHGDWFRSPADYLLAAAEQVGKPFVAEFYWTPLNYETPPSIAQLTRDLAIAGCEWQAQGEWVIMRHTDRPEARKRDLPPSALEKWFFKPKQRGVLTIQDLVQMGDYASPELGVNLFLYLAFLGLRHNLVYHGELPHPYVMDRSLLALPAVHHGLLYALCSLEPMENRSEVFAAFMALSAAQRRALVNGQAIRLEELTPQARRALYAFLGLGDPARVPAFWSDAPPQGTVRLESREIPEFIRRLPAEKARQARDVDTARRLWNELQDAVGDYEKFTERYTERLCCVRVWYLQVRVGHISREADLLYDYSPLLQRGLLPPTP